MLDLEGCFMTSIQHVERPCSVMIVLMCAASSICGQTDSLQDQLNSTYKGKILLLRNFYSGTDLEYDQNGTLVSRASQGHGRFLVLKSPISALRSKALRLR